MKSYFKIMNRKIGENFPPLIIVELGINHNGSLDKAISLVDLAIKNGAEVIKHQTHVLDDEMSEKAKIIKPGNASKSIYEVIKKNSLNYEDEKKLANYVKKKKKIFISTPFSRKAVQRLIKFNVPAFKIGSGECNNYPFIDYVCKFKKPIILSTGMNSIKTIKPSVDIIRKYNIPFALLHCTNIYPTPPKLVRLNGLSELKKNFPDAVIGLSDHTETIHTAFGAIALGASIIEKHFTKSKKDKGPDIKASIDPDNLRELIKGTKIIFQARDGKKKPLKEEKSTINFAFASVAILRNIKKGEKLSEENIFPIRPGNGYFKPDSYKYLLGKKSSKNLFKGNQLKKNDVI